MAAPHRHRCTYPDVRQNHTAQHFQNTGEPRAGSPECLFMHALLRMVAHHIAAVTQPPVPIAGKSLQEAPWTLPQLDRLFPTSNLLFTHLEIDSTYGKAHLAAAPSSMQQTCSQLGHRVQQIRSVKNLGALATMRQAFLDSERCLTTENYTKPPPTDRLASPDSATSNNAWPRATSSWAEGIAHL